MKRSSLAVFAASRDAFVVSGRINRVVASLVIEGVRAQLPHISDAHPDFGRLDTDDAESVPLEPYRSLIRAAVDEGGGAILLRAGQSLRGLSHPLLFVLLNSDSPLVLIEKEQRLAGFIHSRHRIVVESASPTSLELLHVSEQDEQPDPLEDLAGSGQHIALLQEIGCRGLRLRFPKSRAPDRWVYREPHYEEPAPGGGYGLWHFEWDSLIPTRRPMEGLDELLLGTVTEPTVTEEVSLAEGVERIVRRDLSRTWRLSGVAEALGTSTRSLQRELANAGATFSDLVDRTRNEEAARLLKGSKLSVTEIGFACGFADTAHFSRRFKTRYGTSPSAWRDQQKVEVGAEVVEPKHK